MPCSLSHSRNISRRGSPGTESNTITLDGVDDFTAVMSASQITADRWSISALSRPRRHFLSSARIRDFSSMMVDTPEPYPVRLPYVSRDRVVSKG